MFSMFGWSTADNEEVETESGASRMCSAFCCAICGFPILLLVMVILLGWNEKRAVCDARAIAQGKREAVEAGCGSATEGDGKLVIFSCDMKKDGLTAFTTGTGAFSTSLNSYIGTGLNIKSEMNQCMEKVESKTSKDSVGGGKTTTKTYTYSVQWKDTPINSGSFKKKDSTNYKSNCGAENPSWPTDVPQTSKLLASVVQVGNFKIEKSHIEKIPLDTPVSFASPPTGWTGTANPYTSDTYKVSGKEIGKMKASFFGMDWTNPMVTVLGENKKGTIKQWVAKDSWLCSGYTVSDLQKGKVSKDKMFADMEKAARSLTWILRLLGLIIGWVAFCLLAGPLEVAADCVPCIGPCLGDSLMCVASCVSCLPATACALGVIGIVWVIMRPMVGGALMAVFMVIVCCLAGFKVYAKQADLQGKGGGGAEPEPTNYGA